jgi:hypothetical protein
MIKKKMIVKKKNKKKPITITWKKTFGRMKLDKKGQKTGFKST